MRFLILALSFFAFGAIASPAHRDGWSVTETTLTYEALLDRLKGAIKANKMGLVTQAGPTGAAASRGITIPGNRVLGVFNNRFAVRMLTASEAAMIEAPVRFYVTEQPDGTATLSYKLPSFIFQPYEGDSPDVAAIGAELDVIFAQIAADATN
ncbi:MAG: DUF302 domain-containing protein [Pseudomonadota bacterium]